MWCAFQVDPLLCIVYCLATLWVTVRGVMIITESTGTQVPLWAVI